jgi:transcription elongation factor Elf1
MQHYNNDRSSKEKEHNRPMHRMPELWTHRNILYQTFMCVKCGGEHNTTVCRKKPNTPAKCGLCGGAHPANYKGCDIYSNLQKIRNQKGRQQYQNTTQQNAHININDNNQFPPLNPNQPLTEMYSTPRMPYSQAATQNQPPANNNITEPLIIFLIEFEAMFSQLLNQNSRILNMLSTVINKIH